LVEHKFNSHATTTKLVMLPSCACAY